jgi:hypothetical protein
MKPFLRAAVVLALAFAAGKAAAFPLTLTSLTATASVTPSYSAIASTNKAQYTTHKFTIKDVTLLMSNSLVYLGSNPPPANAYIVFEPHTGETYLTNSAGYHQNVSETFMHYRYYVQMKIENLAAKFTRGNGTVTEDDSVVTFFGFNGIGPDGGVYYAAANYGIGSLKYKQTAKGASMSITGTGPDEGSVDSSSQGVSDLSFTFAGKNPTAEWSGPFFLWWDK